MKWVIVLIVNIIGFSMLAYNISSSSDLDFGLIPVAFFMGAIILTWMPKKYYQIPLLQKREDELK